MLGSRECAGTSESNPLRRYSHVMGAAQPPRAGMRLNPLAVVSVIAAVVAAAGMFGSASVP